MASIYADEDVPRQVVVELRALGHDVLTVHDDGLGNSGVPDVDVLARATQLGRSILTKNRSDYHKLHAVTVVHAGIITFTQDGDYAALAGRIHTAISSLSSLLGQLIKVTRPHPSQQVP